MVSTCFSVCIRNHRSPPVSHSMVASDGLASALVPAPPTPFPTTPPSHCRPPTFAIQLVERHLSACAGNRLLCRQEQERFANTINPIKPLSAPHIPHFRSQCRELLAIAQ